MSKLPSQGYLLQCFTYDPETGLLTWRPDRPEHHFSRPNILGLYRARYAGWVVKAKTKAGYVVASIDGRKNYAHRIIWKMMTGEEPETIDHIDMDPANNRWSNLRAATTAEQHANKRAAHRVYHGLPKGVTFAARRAHTKKPYVAFFRGRCLGYFATPEEAHRAWAEVAQPIQGPFFRRA